jgi:CxxC motif-containing protein
MKKELICVVCPNSCRLAVDAETMEVSGNLCNRGIDFVRNELTCPKRTVCTTVATVFPELPMLPVRTRDEIPKELIFDVIKALACVKVTEKVKRGDVIFANICNSGVDVVSSEDIEKVLEENKYE